MTSSSFEGRHGKPSIGRRRQYRFHRVAIPSVAATILTYFFHTLVCVVVVLPSRVTPFLRPRVRQSLLFSRTKSAAHSSRRDLCIFGTERQSCDREDQAHNSESRLPPSKGTRRRYSKGQQRNQNNDRNNNFKESRRKQRTPSSARTNSDKNKQRRQDRIGKPGTHLPTTSVGRNGQRRHNRIDNAETKVPTAAAIEFNKWLTQSLRDGYVTVQQAEQKLLERLESYNENSNSTSSHDNRAIRNFDSISFNLVLKAWARERSLTAARRADALLEVLHKHSSGNIPWLQADTYSYGSVLHAYAKSGGKRAAALRADELLLQMERRLGPKQISTTDVCHNAAMDCWSVSGDADAGRRAGAILRRLEEQYAKRIGPRPTRISFNTCMKAYARSKPPNGPIEAHRILNRMKDLGGVLSPDKISYSICIDAYCRSGETTNHHHNWTWAAIESEALLTEMEQASQESNGRYSSNLRPDVVAYTSVLVCYAKAGMEYQKATDLISRMERFAGQKPNTTFLNTLLHLFAKTGKAKHAEALLQTMQKSQMADKISYTTVVSAHANAVDAPANSTRAMQLLSELEELYNKTKDERYLPSAKTFASVLNVISKSESHKSKFMNRKVRKQQPNEDEDVLAQIDALLHRLDSLFALTRHPDLRINTVVYNQVFQVLSNAAHNEGSRSSIAVAKRAMELLNQMKAQQTTNTFVRPEAATYAYFINAITKSRVPNAAEVATHVLEEVEQGYEGGDDALKPTKLLYSAVLQAYAKSSSSRGADLAEQLLKRTQDLYQTKGRLYAKPTTLYFNAVMDAHARNPSGGREGALRCEALLDELETKARAGDDKELTPTTRSYNAVLLAYKNSNDPDAPQRAEALLKRMNERYKNGDANCRPDRVTMNSIISVWAKCNCQYDKAAQRAEQFLDFMETLYKDVGDKSLKPDSYSYNSVIDAYAKQQQYHSENEHNENTAAVLRAEYLFDRMQALCRGGDDSLCPDIITLTSLRHAWTHCKHPDSAQKIQDYSSKISHLRQQQKQLQRHHPASSPTDNASTPLAIASSKNVSFPELLGGSDNTTQTVATVALRVLEDYLP